MKFLREASIFGAALIIGGYIFGHRSTLLFTSSTEYLGILGLVVAILTFLIAFLAIVFTYLLHRQSNEYKNSFKESLDALVAEGRKNFAKKADAEIASLTLKMEKASVTEREDMKKRIVALEAEKNSYSSGRYISPTLSMGPTGPTGPSIFSSFPRQVVTSDPWQQLVYGSNYALPNYLEPNQLGREKELSRKITELEAKIKRLEEKG